MPTSHFSAQIFRRQSAFFFCVTLIIALAMIGGWKSLSAAKQDDGQTATASPGHTGSGDSAYRSPTGKHKLRVTDHKIAAELKRQGAQFVADYGLFQVFNADEQLVGGIKPGNGVSFSDEDNLVLLNAGTLDTTRPELQQQRGRAESFSNGEAGLHLVQFAGPIKPNWYAALEATGVKIVNYIPNNAYLVYGEEQELARLTAWASRSEFVQWDGEYKSEYKLDPSLSNFLRGNLIPGDDNQLMAIQLVADENGNQATKQAIESLKIEPIRSEYKVLGFLNIIVKLPVVASDRILAARPDVVSVSRYVVPEKFDERQSVIMTGNLSGNQPTASDYLTYLNNQGFTQTQFTNSGFNVNVVDSGIDNATTSPNHFALYVGGLVAGGSRVIFNRLVGTPNAGTSTLEGCDGHGNINAHIIGGFIPTGAPYNAFPHADASGFRYGLGVAPFVRLASTVVFDPNTWTFPSLPAIESLAYNDNSRISSNSWGSNVGGAYTVDSQAYDVLVRDAQPAGAPINQAGNQEMVIVFSAGNQGPSSTSIGAPGTAKNVITVGAAENVLAFGGSDGCGVADTGADSANDIIGFSSRGPTTDGRNKPEIVAPGTHITGGVAQDTNPPANGQSNPCYSGNGICGGAGGADYFPAGQQFYSASSGTSHSAPAVAGAAALLRQRFLNASLAAPSPAMTKAVLMNSARYMTGVNANDNLWSNVQGMGEVNLTTALNLFSAPSVLRDQMPADTFTASGQSQVFSGSIVSSAQPFRVTLAWTDAPGSTVGNSFVNNLDLEVTVGGQTYKGNVFSGASSTTGGSADTRNNAESVFIPAGISGSFTVRVLATNIAGDGVPNSGGFLDQDFALVIGNATTIIPQAVIAPAGSAITAEGCAPGNNAVDPGETVTVNLSLQNVGNANTTNLVATLQATGGVNNPSAAQNYGALAFGGASVSKSFSFIASGACGGTVTATLNLQDGATNLGTATFTFTLGTTVLTSTTFSSATAMTIPSGAPATTVGNATPYPGTINVTGLTGTVNKITLTLTGVNHTFPDDMDLLLVGPNGQKVILMSDAGGVTDIVNANLTFDDTGAAIPNSSAITTGTYSPANYDGTTTDVFSAPAPVGPYAELLSAFNGTAPNGIWSLYVVDDSDGEVGSITGGWSLTVTTAAPGCCSVACPTITVNPPTVPNGIVGRAYSQQFTQTGGFNPILFSVSIGNLPPGLTLSASGLLSGAPTESGMFSFTVQVTDGNTCIGSQAYTMDVVRLQFYPLAAPIRLLDTRPGQTGCDAPGAAITGATSRTQTARRTCSGQTIPANAMAITGNITTVQSGGGYLTLYPSDIAQPTVANSNYSPNEVLNNVFTVGLGEPDGAFKIFVTTTTHVVIDVSGYYAPPSPSGLYFHPLPKPIRLLETRAGFTGCNATGTPIPAITDTTQGSYLTCDSVTIPNTARAIVGNATVVGPAANGYMTLFPADVTRPLVASSNFTTGQTMNSPFTVGLSSAGEFKIYSTVQTDLVIDVLGYYSADATDANGTGLLFTSLPRPVRLFESRPGFSGCTATGTVLVGGTTYTQNARGVCDGMTVSNTALAIVGNATVVNPALLGYLTFWPSSVAIQPVVATSNYALGQTFNRHFIVGLGSGDGAFKMFSQRNTHLVIDLSGYFAP
ncbi:MAG: S8 family serine peptidase [Blastocatellia bacterium]